MLCASISLSRLRSSCNERMFPLLQKSIIANSRGNLNSFILMSSLKKREKKIPYCMRMNNKILATDLWLSSYRKMLFVSLTQLNQDAPCTLEKYQLQLEIKKKNLNRMFDQWLHLNHIFSETHLKEKTSNKSHKTTTLPQIIPRKPWVHLLENEQRNHDTSQSIFKYSEVDYSICGWYISLLSFLSLWLNAFWLW